MKIIHKIRNIKSKQTFGGKFKVTNNKEIQTNKSPGPHVFTGEFY